MFAAMDLAEMYKKMGMPADQIELLQKAGVLDILSRWGPWLGVAGGIGVARLFAVRAALFLPRQSASALVCAGQRIVAPGGTA